MKRNLSLLSVLILLSTQYVFSQFTVVTPSGHTMECYVDDQDSTLYVSQFTGSGIELIVPATVEYLGTIYKVSHLPQGAFHNLPHLQRLTTTAPHLIGIDNLSYLCPNLDSVKIYMPNAPADYDAYVPRYYEYDDSPTYDITLYVGCGEMHKLRYYYHDAADSLMKLHVEEYGCLVDSSSGHPFRYRMVEGGA